MGGGVSIAETQFLDRNLHHCRTRSSKLSCITVSVNVFKANFLSSVYLTAILPVCSEHTEASDREERFPKGKVWVLTGTSRQVAELAKL
jgi:hypothetical protein